MTHTNNLVSCTPSSSVLSSPIADTILIYHWRLPLTLTPLSWFCSNSRYGFSTPVLLHPVRTKLLHVPPFSVICGSPKACRQARDPNLVHTVTSTPSNVQRRSSHCNSVGVIRLGTRELSRTDWSRTNLYHYSITLVATQNSWNTFPTACHAVLIFLLGQRMAEV